MALTGGDKPAPMWLRTHHGDLWPQVTPVHTLSPAPGAPSSSQLPRPQTSPAPLPSAGCQSVLVPESFPQFQLCSMPARDRDTGEGRQKPAVDTERSTSHEHLGQGTAAATEEQCHCLGMRVPPSVSAQGQQLLLWPEVRKHQRQESPGWVAHLGWRSPDGP